jgi:hypothetical protein
VVAGQNRTMTIGFYISPICGTRKKHEKPVLITSTKEKAEHFESGLRFQKLVAGVGFEPTTFGL